MIEINHEKIILDLKNVLKKAGNAVMKNYRKDIKIRNKSNNTPVTNADIESQKILFKKLIFYGFPIISEEGEFICEKTKNELYWLVDPLDGTENFLRKNEDFCIMIALVNKSEPELGIIYMPKDKIFYYAFKNGGCFKQKYQEIPIKQHVINRDFRDLTMVVSRHHLSVVEKNISKNLQIKKVLPKGSVGLKACMIATGKAQIYMKKSDKMGNWDICSSDIIVREAGGIVTDLKGKELKYKFNSKNTQGFLITTNRNIHSTVLNKLKNYL